MKIGNYFFKIKLFLVRLLCYEKPLRVVFTKYLSLLFKTFRPHYESVLYEECLEAKKLGRDWVVLSLKYERKRMYKGVRNEAKS